MPDTATKPFHIGDILSITTGCLVSPRHIEGVYEILNWMTGDSLFTHQLPRACGECAPSLREQFPDLGAIVALDDFGDKGELVHAWVAEQVAAYGETREVAPLAAEDHTRMDPLSELAMMVPPEKIIAIGMPGPPDA